MSNPALCATSTAPPSELQEGGQRCAEPWRSGDHRVGDPGQQRDERGDASVGVDQGLELAEHLPPAHLDGADLGDLGVLGATTGGLEIDHHEGHLAQWGAQLLEADLHADGHGAHARSSHRHPDGAGSLARGLSAVPQPLGARARWDGRLGSTANLARRTCEGRRRRAHVGSGTVMAVALLYGLVSAASLPLGALVGVSWTPSDRLLAVLLAFGGGALLAALTLDLVAPGVSRGHAHDLALGAVTGGVLFKLLDYWLSRRGAYLRKHSTALTYWRRQARRRLDGVLAGLQRTQPLGHLPDDVKEELLSIMQVRDLPAGTWLHRVNDPPKHLMILEDGVLQLRDPQLDGAVFEELGRHAAFGRMSFLTGLPRATEAYTPHGCRVLVIPREPLMELALTSSELRTAIRRLVSDPEVTTYLVERYGIQVDAAARWQAEAVADLDQGTIYPPPRLPTAAPSVHARVGAGGRAAVRLLRRPVEQGARAPRRGVDPRRARGRSHLLHHRAACRAPLPAALGSSAAGRPGQPVRRSSRGPARRELRRAVVLRGGPAHRHGRQPRTQPGRRAASRRLRRCARRDARGAGQAGHLPARRSR